jgi:prepilin-type N-terminal cleavage/methylation domain-containing protein
MNFNEPRRSAGSCGFTLIEIIIVVVILGIAAMIAVPMFSSAADMTVRAAANRITADLEYAKGMAITHQKPYSVVFDLTTESYEIRDTATDAVINDPVRPGSAYRVNFSTDGNFSRVNIDDADFDADSTHAVTFDYLGSPYHGKSISSGDALNSGRITLKADAFTLYVDVEPMTGYVTVTGP